jgi:hypothetical protein
MVVLLTLVRRDAKGSRVTPPGMNDLRHNRPPTSSSATINPRLSTSHASPRGRPG